MSRTLEKPIQKPKPNTCQVVKSTSGQFCVRCNWRSATQDGGQWSCRPDCGGEIALKKNAQR